MLEAHLWSHLIREVSPLFVLNPKVNHLLVHQLLDVLVVLLYKLMDVLEELSPGKSQVDQV